jgi:RimJ/RimL family protein N-acetyltransferase
MSAPNPLTGPRLRLAAIDTDKDLPVIAAWSRDSEFLRLLQTNLARPWTLDGLRHWIGEDQGADAPRFDMYGFGIRTLADDRLIGNLDLTIPDWSHRDGWIGIAIGERADWNHGYGSEAMRLLLRFAFAELNLFRVTLSVFGYNPRAIHVYEKLGFVEEGRQRDRLRRDGQLYDLIIMGLLRSEWQAAQESQPA